MQKTVDLMSEETSRLSNHPSFDPPKTLFIELTSHCNMHCTFCPSDILRRRKEQLADSRFRKLMDEVQALDIKAPVLLNVLGEPLLNKKLFEYLDLFEAHGHPVTLITNMTLLADKRIQREILKHNNVTLAMSLQTVTRQAYRMRGCDKLHFKDFFPIFFDVVEEKFRTGSSVRLEIHVASNYVLSHDPSVQSDSGLYLWPNFSSEEAELKWIRRMLDRLDRFARTIRSRYPRAFEDERNFALKKYRDHLGSRVALTRDQLPENFHRLKDEVFWGYMFLPNVLLVFKSLELWARDLVFIKSVVPADKYVYIEENTEPRECIMAENVGLLSNGDFVLCCLDYEGEMRLGNIDTTRVEDALRSEKRAAIRRNAMTEEVCRRCKGRVFVFDTGPLAAKEQVVDKFGGGWWDWEKDLYGVGGRWTQGLARSYVFVRIPARMIEIRFFSELDDTAPLYMSLQAYDEEAKTFREEKSVVFYGKKGSQGAFAAAFDFSPSRLYRIELSTPTFIPGEGSGSGDTRRLGLAVFEIRLFR
jgi:radical SAM protein with 4Fe4S-binding SPASM domain